MLSLLSEYQLADRNSLLPSVSTIYWQSCRITVICRFDEELCLIYSVFSTSSPSEDVGDIGVTFESENICATLSSFVLHILCFNLLGSFSVPSF